MKRRVLTLVGIVFIALFSMSNSSLKKLDMKAPSEVEEIGFDFKYTGTVNTGKEVMPLVGQLSKDGLKMYLTSQNFRGEKQLYVMRREKIGDEFGVPEKLRGTINNEEYDIIMPTVSGDEKTMVFVNSINGTQKGNDLYISSQDEQRNNDLYVSSRIGTNGPFANIRVLDELNDPELSDSYPWISNDGLRIYFTKQKGSNITFHYAERDDVNSKFKKVKNLDIEVPKVSNNMSCFFSLDEMEIFVLSGDKIYHATRESYSDKFSALAEIAESNDSGYMSGITMTPDQSELFVFNSIGFRNTQILRFVNTEAGKKDKQRVTAAEDRYIDID